MHVTAVIVAYNRCELLAEALAALLAQTRPPDSVIVVDNASTDGSADAAEEVSSDFDVIRLGRNTGGAGGFAVGIERAITAHTADFVWIMDDDTVPTATALEELLSAHMVLTPSPLIMASRVVWTDGSEHPMNTPRAKPFASPAEQRAAAEAKVIPVRSTSFVSTLVATSPIRHSGLPIADYFIWNDDFEFTSRILRTGRGVYCPRSVVVHKTRALASTDADPGDRFYFEVRNKIWLFRASRALSFWEKPVYIGASLRRWSVTFLHSKDRRTLLTALRRGIRDGFGSLPARNSESLGDLGRVGDDMRRFERAADRTD